MTANHYASVQESIRVVVDTCEVLNISPYRLHLLIGLPQAFMIYRWLSGEHRPSQRYLTRMNILLCMQLQKKINVARIEKVIWPEGKIVYKPDMHGNRTGPDVKLGSSPMHNRVYELFMSQKL